MSGLRTIVLLLATAACCLLAVGCGAQEKDKPLLEIVFDGAETGALGDRVRDMRRAAQLALEQTNFDTKQHRLRLIGGSGPSEGERVAAIRAPNSNAPPGARGGGWLEVALTPYDRMGPQETIWMLPPEAMVDEARDDYLASGLPASRLVVADLPTRPGTPAGTYVTPALSAASYPPAGRRFFEAYADEYGSAPDRYAIFAYEATGLIVDAIQRLEAKDETVTPESVRDEAFTIKNRYGPVGHYDVLPDGRTTLYIFQARGDPSPPESASLIEVGR